jgi:hypothetical protein
MRFMKAIGAALVAASITLAPIYAVAGGTKPTPVPAWNGTLDVAGHAPTGTVSLTGVMQGLGYHFTPLRTGKARIAITLYSSNTLANDTNYVSVRYGTGTAPVNGAAVTGTAAAPITAATSATAAANTPVTLFVQITGLTMGTNYWIDLNLLTANASGTATVVIVSVLIEEPVA